ncbi:MAG: effector-associated domain EAD1-containing protein [Nostocaceae cyanobacterium]|nr:effector-associated domain EAD1-containing protein [Nostocaceae cyanobacterium]
MLSDLSNKILLEINKYRPKSLYKSPEIQGYYHKQVVDEIYLLEKDGYLEAQPLYTQVSSYPIDYQNIKITQKGLDYMNKNKMVFGEQCQKLQNALISAFPDKSSLEQMLYFKLDKNLDVIAGEGNLQEIVFKLIKKAESENWVENLIDAARKSNPGNQLLKDITYCPSYEQTLPVEDSKRFIPSNDAVVKKRIKAVIENSPTGIVNLYNSRIFIRGEKISMSGNNTIHTIGGNYNESGIYSEHVEGDSNRNNYYAAEQKQTLKEAAAEIQALLEHLEKSYPTDTTPGKMALATEAIAQIDSNLTLKARIISALKTGGVEAFEQFLSHPAASFVIGALKDWQKTKGS